MLQEDSKCKMKFSLFLAFIYNLRHKHNDNPAHMK